VGNRRMLMLKRITFLEVRCPFFVVFELVSACC